MSTNPTNSTSKRLYIMWTVISYLVTIVPVAIYNLVNYKAFENISAIKLTFTGLITLSMIGLAALTKMKKKTGVWVFVIGAILAILGEISGQIGYSLLMIGGSMLLDQFVFSKIAKIYKVRWYNETGRQITYTSSID
jgi:hypothetical protein